MEMLLITATLLSAINIAAFGAFWIDKRRAVKQEWRISEGTLLGLAFVGGWVGAKLAQRRFRHKTRKQPFARHLNAVPVVWGIAAFLALAVPYVPQEWINTYTQQEEEPRHSRKFFTSVNR